MLYHRELIRLVLIQESHFVRNPLYSNTPFPDRHVSGNGFQPAREIWSRVQSLRCKLKVLPKPWFNRGIGLLLDVKKLSKVQLFVDAAVFLSVCIGPSLKGSQLPKMKKKKVDFYMSLSYNLQVEAFGPSLSIYTFKITSVSMLNLGQFREIDVLSITT